MSETFSDRLKRWEPFLFYGLIALFLYPVWANHYLFSTDGLIHLANSQLIAQLLDGSCPLAAEIFRFNERIVPNWLGHAIMASGILVGLPPLIMEKAVFSLCILLWVWGLRYVISAFPQGNLSISWFVLPFLTYWLLVAGGTYNFCLSIGFWLIGTGFYLHYRHRGQAFWSTGLLLLALLGWFSHLLGFLLLGYTIGFLTLWAVLSESGEEKRNLKLLLQRLLQKTISLLVVFMPGIILTVLYLLSPHQQFQFADVQNRPAGWTYIMRLMEIPLLTDYVPEVIFPTPLLIVVPFGVPLFFLGMKAFISVKHNFLSPAKSILLSAFLLWLLSLVVPDSFAGGWLIETRLRLAGWCLVLIGLALSEIRPFLRNGLLLWAVTSFLIQSTYFADWIKEGNTLTEKLLPKEKIIADHSLVFSIPQGSLGHIRMADGKRMLMPAVGSALGLGRCVVDLNNYEAYHDYFPLRFREGASFVSSWGYPVRLDSDALVRNAYPYFGLDVEDYSYQNIDYLLLWGNEKTLLNDTLLPAAINRYHEERVDKIRQIISPQSYPEYQRVYTDSMTGGKILQIYEHQYRE